MSGVINLSDDDDDDNDEENVDEEDDDEISDWKLRLSIERLVNLLQKKQASVLSSNTLQENSTGELANESEPVHEEIVPMVDIGDSALSDMTFSTTTTPLFVPNKEEANTADSTRVTVTKDSFVGIKRMREEDAAYQETYRRMILEAGLVNAFDKLHTFVLALLSGRCSHSVLKQTSTDRVTVSLPGIRTLLLSQKFLLRPFNFKVPNVDYYRLTGHPQLIGASVCFGDLIFLMVLVNLPNQHSFELLHEMLSTHLNFQVYIDKEKALHTQTGRYISCPFFWTSRGLHFLDIPFNLQFHGLLRVSLNEQSGLIESARILFDPTVVIRQCDCISQYFKANVMPSSFRLYH